MSYLVRRINLGMWKDYCEKAIGRNSIMSRICIYPRYDCPADIITKGLATSGNTLSFWEIEDKSKINDAILAISTGTTQSNLGTVYYVIFDRKELELNGIEIKQSSDDANTAVAEFKAMHHNLTNVSYYSLGHLQDLIVKKILAGEDDKMTKGDIKPLMEKLIIDNKIDYTVLSDDYLRHLKQDFKQYSDRIPDVKAKTVTCPNCSLNFEVPIV